uniref:Uncharacterized protein n=1 Tax=Arundo donax TaxID=35708 RepID=A0A0A9FA42_ARUDO
MCRGLTQMVVGCTIICCPQQSCSKHCCPQQSYSKHSYVL